MRKQVLFTVAVAATLGFTSLQAQNTFPSSGNVGIGTTAPISKLQIVDGVNTGGGYYKPMRIYNPNLLTGEHVQLAFGKANSTYNQGEVNFNLAGGVGSASNTLSFGLYGNPAILTLQGTGNVGIGTATPSAPLDLQNTVGGQLARFNGGANMYMGIYEAGIYRGYIGSYAGNAEDVDFGTGAGTTGKLHLTIQTSPKLTIDNAGNVGVGTTSPNYILDVANRMRLRSGGGSNSAGIWLNNLDNSAITGFMGVYDNNNMGFYGSSSGWSLVMNTATGNVGIGTANPSYKLSVNGTIQAKEVRVETGWADYVFEKDYKLQPLKQVEKYIEQNKHLPGIASAEQIQEKGVAIGEMLTKMMEKIEELTLYNIELQNQTNQLQKQVNHLQHQYKNGLLKNK